MAAPITPITASDADAALPTDPVSLRELMRPRELVAAYNAHRAYLQAHWKTMDRVEIEASKAFTAVLELGFRHVQPVYKATELSVATPPDGKVQFIINRHKVG